MLECQQKNINVPLHAEFMLDKAVRWADAVLVIAFFLRWNCSLTIFYKVRIRGIVILVSTGRFDRRTASLACSFWICVHRPRILSSCTVYLETKALNCASLEKPSWYWVRNFMNICTIGDLHGFCGFFNYVSRLRKLVKKNLGLATVNIQHICALCTS